MFSACNKDDHTELDVSYKPQKNEVKIIFNPTTDNREALLYISGKDFSIDWGDGKTSTRSDIGEDFSISHVYQKDKEQVITITTNGRLESLQNCNRRSILEIEEEKTPTYESITIGTNVTIDNLYIQASGIKRMTFENDKGCEKANILLNSSDWDISMVKTPVLHLYLTQKNNLEIKELNASNLEIIAKHKMNNLHISSCSQLQSLTISALIQKEVEIDQIKIDNMPQLAYLKLYATIGTIATAEKLPSLKQLSLNNFHYKTLTMDSEVGSSSGLTFKAVEFNVSRPIKFSNQLAEVEINNTSSTYSSEVETLDFSNCQQLRTLRVSGLNKLESINLGDDNKTLDEVNLKELPKLIALDLSRCKNLKNIEVSYAGSLRSAKFSADNELLKSIEFYNCSFTAESCIDMLQTLPNFPIPGISEANRRGFRIVDNTPSLGNNAQINEITQGLKKHWSIFIE